MSAYRPLPTQPESRVFLPWDLCFLACVALYAWLCHSGILPVSGMGAVMDSDLMTYAQGMAGAANPGLFAADPVLRSASAANSIPNAQRLLAAWLAQPGEWGAALLAAGAIAIFVFYSAWYLFGRWLCASPALGALLAITSGITVWAGWGTFWGVNHSDPVPRVFFAALMPVALWLAVLGARRAALRPAAMAVTGIFIWAHGVSALNLGAMLFMAFFCLRVPGQSFGAHLGNLFLCLCAFFIPVLIFLWPSLFQARQFSADELTMLQEMMELRWHADYGNLGRRFLAFFSPQSAAFPILLGGLISWVIVLAKGVPRVKAFARMCPAFLAALLCVTAFCWAESHYSSALGRIPMGHELVRGLRLLIPIAWILIAAAIGCLCGPWLRRAALVAAILLFACFSQDRQLAAAQYAIWERLGLNLPLTAKARAEQQEAAAFRAVIEALGENIPAGETVYCPEDAMPVRYIALRPLIHSFKDGYVHFYNKDVESCRKWLELEKIARTEPDGWIKAWQASGAPWLLCRASALAAGSLPGRVILEKNGWALLKAGD